MIDLHQGFFVLLMGLGTFFSPCAVALLPAYVAYFTGLGPTGADTRAKAGPSFLRGLRFAGAASLGIIAVFGAFGAVIYLLRSIFHIPSAWLATGLGGAGIFVGVIIILLGILMLTGRAPNWTPRFAAPQEKTFTSMMLFGGIYALASLGCTLPLFFAVLVQVLIAGPIGGSILLVVYVVGFAGLMFAATLLLTLAEDATRRVLRKIMPYVKPVSAALLIAAGIFILYYYLVLTPPV